MVGLRRSCDDIVAKQLGIVFMLSCCIAAALLTHSIIDLLGDVVLAHDAYDDLAHASRPVGAIAIGVGLLVTLGFALRAAFLEAQGSERALLTLLRRALPICPWRHFASVAALSLVLVAAMEACDSFAAGHACDDVVELFGGSLLLAALVATAVAAVVTVSIRAGLRHITKLHTAIIAMIVAFIRIACAQPALSAFERHNRRGSYRRAEMRGSSAGDRAPPGFSSLVFL